MLASHVSVTANYSSSEITFGGSIWKKDTFSTAESGFLETVRLNFLTARKAGRRYRVHASFIGDVYVSATFTTEGEEQQSSAVAVNRKIVALCCSLICLV